MSLTEKINSDIKTAMLAREKEKLEALRAIKSALLLEATKGGSEEISEDTELSILKKLYKQRIDAAKIYVDQDRKDLADVETSQATIIKEYLPEQMSEDAVRSVVEGAVAKVGATGMADMGKVMGACMGQLNGKADGGTISKIVKETLNNL